MPNYNTLPYAPLKRFCEDVFAKYGFTAEESASITDVLLSADLFGIESHGIQRMVRYHYELGEGMVHIHAVPKMLKKTPVSVVIDADKSMGQVIGVAAMEEAITMAETTGIGMAAVCNSNHYGIAGYFAQMAAERDLMGICMTNTEAIGVPVLGKQAMLGTNPIALAFPADPVTFLYDAATTVVPRGKLEVYNKNGKALPDGWAVDIGGHASGDADEILRNIIAKAGGGISPLGGSTEMLGGHKGYGLGIIVELFTGILSGGKTANHINVEPERTDITHFFMAVDYGLFGDKAEIRSRFSTFLDELRNSPKADGEARIYTHGEKELESREQKLKEGVPVNQKTQEEMRAIAASHGLDYDSYFPD
jgi:LDH2 family malate/lactate/ureidoglycolate dehydrogenase